MKISSIQNNYNPAFSARNKNIRKADDIQRRARQTFPMLSPSYIEDFYQVTRLDKQNNPVNPKARKIFKKVDSRLTAIRAVSKHPEEYGVRLSQAQKEAPYALRLNGIEFLKSGNCEECAIAALAALTANGIYDSQRVVLGLETEIKDKETGLTLYRAADSLDHSFVITTMGKKNPKDKDKIVVDPWLGFADSISGAKARFKQIYNDDTFEDITAYRKSVFRVEMSSLLNRIIDLNDYDIRSNFVFYPADKYTEDDLKNLGLYSRIMYSDLMLPKKERKN